MTQPYKKPALTFADQVKKLTSNGLEISDEAAAAAKLSCISYYRLSAYCYPFRTRKIDGTVTDQLAKGTSLDQVMTLYEFDRNLRLLVLNAIERVEIAIRTQFTYHFSLKYGAFGHTNSANFHEQFRHIDWLTSIETEVTRSQDEFIRHYKNKYDGFPTLPLWMLTEVISLGSLSRVFQGLKPDDKRSIADHFGLHHKRLAAWLHTLTYVRNVCAHHSRLWNRELAIRPDQAKNQEWLPPITPRNDRVFYVLLMLKKLLIATGNGEDWKIQVDTILLTITKNRQWRLAMGIPDDWKRHPIWI